MKTKISDQMRIEELEIIRGTVGNEVIDQAIRNGMMASAVALECAKSELW